MKDEELNRPPALNIYQDLHAMLYRLTDQELAHVMRAALEYFQLGDVTQQLDRAEQLIFESVRAGIDRSSETWKETSEQRRNAANKRWNAERQKQQAENQ